MRRNGGRSMKSSTIIGMVSISLFLLVATFSEISFLMEESYYYPNVGRELLQSSTGGTRTNPVTKKVINDKFCAQKEGTSDLGSTDCPSYLSWLMVTAGGPGIVMACLSFVGFFLYALFHAIACGCCNFGETRCLPPPDGSKVRYWIGKILVFLSTIAACVLLALAVQANTQVNTSVKDIEGTIINSTVAFNNTLNTIVTDLTPLNYTKDVVSYTYKAQDYIKTISGYENQVKVEADKYNGYRSVVFLVSFALPVAFGVLGSVAGIFNVRWLSVIIGFILFFNSVLLWVTFAAHNAVTFAFGDLCVDILGFAGGRAKYLNASSSIFALLGCANGTNVFGDLIVYINNGTNTALNTTCKQVNDLCKEQYVYCGNATCTRTTLPLYKSVIISEPNAVQCRIDTRNSGRPRCPYNAQDPFVGCDNQSVLEPCDFRNHTLQNCPQECNSSQLKSSSQQILDGLNTIITYERVIFENVIPVLNCTFVEDAYQSLEHSACTDLRGATNKISYVSAIDAGFLVPMTIGCLIGWLTYRKAEGEGEFELYDRR
eukprot:TRINITY_DN1563_c0_g1_i1.p1 TRINITY_DN1563_c0_g1~~TRINITY_DN1563_c0_g1_i1.p1  ORF type:complete len:544 (-),score=131.92 TRINITY_DN1563_c0_g1_i1:193-1824(-)